MMQQRSLGAGGPTVGALGFGAMVFEGYYGAQSEGIDTVRRALDLGMTMIDTADAYGAGENELRVGRALKGYRDRAFVATKFGVVFEDTQPSRAFPNAFNLPLQLNGEPTYARRALDNSLQRLDIDHIDLWFLHYPDPGTSIDESVGEMARAVKSGKVRCLGLSNVTADQVRRAHRIHPISAVQYEYSLWRREAETELLPTLRELGIALVAWSPLGNGFLTGAVTGVGEGDFRAAMPRFAPENLQTNRDRFAPFMNIARELHVTPAQLALAWLLHQGPDIIPIPGTRSVHHLEENAGAAAIKLDSATLQRIEQLIPPGLAQGSKML